MHYDLPHLPSNKNNLDPSMMVCRLDFITEDNQKFCAMAIELQTASVEISDTFISSVNFSDLDVWELDAITANI